MLITSVWVLAAMMSAFASATTLFIQRGPSLQARLTRALAARDPAYQPRTDHLDKQGRPIYTNRLILEESPYLLQHAHNPVDWHAWGPKAFAKAKLENKPILLSVGYSTCHWCHVMAKESFENVVIAQLVNRFFVPIKVDRERRPDVDAAYMAAIRIVSGRRGWPMTGFLTPDGKLFAGGTYFPPSQFANLLRRIREQWQTHRPQLKRQAETIAAIVAKSSQTREQAASIDASAVESAVQKLMARHDDLQGGFSDAPKFPNEPALFLLLDHAIRTRDPGVIAALESTLSAMAQGGIYDQIAGGFHRYAIDNEWLVPHFEKMLYNQANLARVYLLMWQLNGKPEFARVARQTLDYALREMRSGTGAFYSAIDADSEGEEGLYYLWTPQQIRSFLKAKDAELALDFYGISDAGNFEGRNILHRVSPFEEYATQRGWQTNRLCSTISRINQRLLTARNKRVAPRRDDKIITAWNAMMISALAQGSAILGEPRYLRAAIRTAEHILRALRDEHGALWRISLHGKVSIQATQADYAYLAEALLMLYDVSGEARWLEHARKTTDEMLDLFQDPQHGGFYMNRTNATALQGMPRIMQRQDGAAPSGNSVALHVLQKLARRTDHLSYEQYAQRTLSAFSGTILRDPTALPYLLAAAAALWRGETGSRQYAAHAAVAVGSVLTGEQLEIDVRIKPGWHINSREPLQDYLTPTVLSLPETAKGLQLTKITYPVAIMRKLGFKNTALALYEGRFKLRAQIKQKVKQGRRDAVVVTLRLQACSDKSCLPPEQLQLMPLLRQPPGAVLAPKPGRANAIQP